MIFRRYISSGLKISLMAALFAGWACWAGADELIRDNFEDVASKHSAGKGRSQGKALTSDESEPEFKNPTFVERIIRFENSEKGCISFDLQRKKVEAEDRFGSVFEIVDPKGDALLLLQVSWESKIDPARPMFQLQGQEFFANGMNLWSPNMMLDRTVEPGEWIHLDLTWNDPVGQYMLYVDGMPLDSEPHDYDPATAESVGDIRKLLNAERTQRGLNPAFGSQPFQQLLAKAKAIRYGIHTRSHSPNMGFRPMANAALDNFVVYVNESVVPIEKLHEQGYDVRNLSGVYLEEGSKENPKESVMLAWSPPQVIGVDLGYRIYRRSQGEKFVLLTPEKVYDLRFMDWEIELGKIYQYSITAVYGKLESKYPPEIAVTTSPFAVASIDANKTIYGGGQGIIATLRGTPDMKASFTIEGVASNIEMEEIDNGVYIGKASAPAGVDIEAADMMGTLTDPVSEESVSLGGASIKIDNTPPETVARIIAEAPWAGEIEISFEASSSKDVDHYLVFRAEGVDPAFGAKSYDTTKELKYIDVGIVSGIEYRYSVAPMDKAGNLGLPSDVVSVVAPLGNGPAISGISFEPFGKPAKPGEIILVVVTGQGDAQVTVDIDGLISGLALVEEGRTGKYVGTYEVKDEDVGPTKTLHAVTALLIDLYGSSALAGPELAIIGEDDLNDKTPPVISDVTHDAFQVAGFSGKLVAGNLLTATMKGEPGCYGSFDIDGVVEGAPMEEAAPGVYKGYYTVGLNAHGDEAALTGVLTDDAGNQTRAVAKKTMDFDTRTRLLVVSSEANLPADGKSAAQITVRAEDANGDGISGHELSLTLSTTEEYTGVVGGGKIEDRKAAAEDEDDLEVKWGGETDAFGEVKAAYTAGFAAKTALLVAKDLTADDIGAGWLNTYIAATTTIELFPRTQKDKPDEAVLTISADPSKLTADGRSKSRIKAILKDLDGNPVENEEIIFTLAGTNGKLKVLRSGRTNADGLAEAEYRAGKAMGTVTITASVPKRGVTANVKIILMSDAPAKIYLVASELRLPADGESTAALSVMATDINDNPNSQAPVAFSILQGQGSLAENKLLTDRNGEGENVFKAGNKAGLVVVEARHTSRPPTEEELRRVYGAVFVPRLEERQERDRIKIEKWLVKSGDEVEKGQALATLNSRKGSWTLVARERGVFVRQIRHERDVVELGDSIGYIELDGEVWGEIYRQ